MDIFPDYPKQLDISRNSMISFSLVDKLFTQR
jgi:hypothetical protein